MVKTVFPQKKKAELNTAPLHNTKYPAQSNQYYTLDQVT